MPFQEGLTGFTVYPFYGMKMPRIRETTNDIILCVVQI